MNSTLNILRKEIREMMTASTVLPIVVMAVLFGAMGSVMGGIEEDVTGAPTVGIVNDDTNGDLAAIAVDTIGDLSELAYNGADVDEGIATVDEAGGIALLHIPANFTERIMSGEPGTIQIYWIMKGAGLLDSISSEAVNGVLWNVNRAISVHLIDVNASVNSTLALNPMTMTETTIFGDRIMDGISPGTLGTMLSMQSLIVPLVMMMLIMVAGGTVISSMGMEKENKTLETLLTLPVTRGSIVTGKLVASALIGLMMAAIYMVGFSYYMTGFSASGELDLERYDIALSALDYLLVGISLFVTLVAALALCMILGTFAKNYKSAQTLTMPIAFLAVVPMLLIIFKDFNTLPPAAQAALFALPFSHPMMAMRSLMFDDYALVLGGIVYSTIFAVVAIALTVWIFKTDRLLTGRIGKKEEGRGRNLLRAVSGRKR
ncbi:MAG: ABC transporter permease [Thermoplasmata archaeon]